MIFIGRLEQSDRLSDPQSEFRKTSNNKETELVIPGGRMVQSSMQEVGV